MSGYRIRFAWDGDAPGLAEHRLSLTTFGESLPLLLRAFRRIAMGLVRDASEDDDPERGGRYTREVESLDLQLSTIGKGSTDVFADAVLHTPPGTTIPMFDDLVERTGRSFVDAVRRESRGQPANAAVRKYLRSVPAGVTRQRYAFCRAETELEVVEIGTPSLLDPVVDVAHLAEVRGSVIGVGFAPGPSEVVLKTADRRLRCSATVSQVNQALALRAGEARAVLVMTETMTRLISIQPVDALPAKQLSPDERLQGFFERWPNTLRRLAE